MPFDEIAVPATLPGMDNPHGPAGWEPPAPTGNQLVTRIMQLLPVVDSVVVAHRSAFCLPCSVAGRRACPTLSLAAATLDLIIYCWKNRTPR